MQGFIFRFVSNVGERYTHGHIFDFYKKLKANPDVLDVLGDGNQRKSYVYVGDAVNGILAALARADRKLNIFNLGTDSYCTVKDSIRWITEYMRVSPHLRFQATTREFASRLVSQLMRLAGCLALVLNKPRVDNEVMQRVRRVALDTSRGITLKIVQYMQENPWLLERGEH